jgi:hypothetical protein
MNILKQYTEPNHKDMLVILPFFNPADSVRITQNLLFVYSKMITARIPVVVIQCIFPGNSPILPESDTYMIVRSNSIAFVKENITSIAIRKNLDKYSKFLMLDSDIVFSSQNWYEKLSNKLNNFDAVHPFQEMCYLDCNLQPKLVYPSVIFKKGEESKQGFGMAFTKQFVLSGALPEECLIGGGDVNLLRIIDPNLQNKAGDLYMPVVNKHATSNPIKYSYLENERIYHLYHNEIKNRQYLSRHDILRKYVNGGKIEDIIYRNEYGVYEWKENIREKINSDIKTYFMNRKDDFSK